MPGISVPAKCPHTTTDKHLDSQSEDWYFDSIGCTILRNNIRLVGESEK